MPDRTPRGGLGRSARAVRANTRGQDWRADVLCRRPGQPWSIALEAQVQLQGEEAYRKRQERFAASGIRALWLSHMSRRLCTSIGASPIGTCRRSGPASGRIRRAGPAAHVHVDGLTLSVADFVSGALSRKLRWYETRPARGRDAHLRKDQCWHRTCRSRSCWPSRLKRQAETHWTSRPFRPGGVWGCICPARLLFQISRQPLAIPTRSRVPLPSLLARGALPTPGLGSGRPHLQQSQRRLHGPAHLRAVRHQHRRARRQARRIAAHPAARGPEARWTSWAPLGVLGGFGTVHREQ